uniref:Uncharacterized protein n=1 Tax=Kalanchoe fedtschenkoi TaxID=63787 RepID=A0A7N0TSL8_KALFE
MKLTLRSRGDQHNEDLTGELVAIRQSRLPAISCSLSKRSFPLI